MNHNHIHGILVIIVGAPLAGAQIADAQMASTSDAITVCDIVGGINAPTPEVFIKGLNKK